MNGNVTSGGLTITGLEDLEMGDWGILLSNGNYIALEIGQLLALPGLDALKENGRIFHPLKAEDGSAIYWRDGPRPVGVEEILALVGKPNCENDFD